VNLLGNELAFHEILVNSSRPHGSRRERDPSKADAAYDSAVRSLLEQRRRPSDRLVFSENCNYGFVRNLVGLKPIGLAAALLTLAVDLFLYLHQSVDHGGLALRCLRVTA
jgi:hypothetical protein